MHIPRAPSLVLALMSPSFACAGWTERERVPPQSSWIFGSSAPLWKAIWRHQAHWVRSTLGKNTEINCQDMDDLNTASFLFCLIHHAFPSNQLCVWSKCCLSIKYILWLSFTFLYERICVYLIVMLKNSKKSDTRTWTSRSATAPLASGTCQKFCINSCPEKIHLTAGLSEGQQIFWLWNFTREVV